MSKVNVSLIVKWNKWDDIPEVLDAWDEYCIDSNPEGFEERVEELRKEHEVPVLIVNTWYEDSTVEAVLTNRGIDGRTK